MIIEMKRLILRPFLETDAADVYEYLKESAVNRFARMKQGSLDEDRAEMKKRLGETEYYFAITLKDGGKVIREIDAYPEAVSYTHLDVYKRQIIISLQFIPQTIFIIVNVLVH